jgi:hypothetical protein
MLEGVDGAIIPTPFPSSASQLPSELAATL